MDDEQRQPSDEERRQPTDEELEARLREEIKRLRVVDVAGEVMVTLVTLGYQKLGLTRETLELRHLPDARLAIELLRGLIETLEREQAGDVQAFRSTLAAMQLQYARVAALPEGELPGGGSAEGPAAGGPAGAGRRGRHDERARKRRRLPGGREALGASGRARAEEAEATRRREVVLVAATLDRRSQSRVQAGSSSPGTPSRPVTGPYSSGRRSPR